MIITAKMVNIPVRFNRLAAAFDEVARVRSCDSSGSEHSPDDLSDLVNSFLEREISEQSNSEGDERETNGNEIDHNNDDELEINSSEWEFHNSLKNLFEYSGNEEDVRGNIRAEVENVLRGVDGNRSSSSPDFKRRLMARLRDRGFDAGLCKSKWEKNGRCPSGDYEYIDISSGGTRYIVEISPATQFTIARPTERFKSLLEIFPPFFVGKPDELKKVVRLMCNAIKMSMKSVDIHVPPWRRLAYLQAKWFGPYKRTTNEISSQKGLNINGGFVGNRSVGFALVPRSSLNCKEEFVVKSGARIGNLAAALKQ